MTVRTKLSHMPNAVNHSRQNIQRKKTHNGNHKKWTDEERDKVAIYFAADILHKRLPGKATIEKFLAESGITRSWTNVKDYLRNQHLRG